MSKLIELSDLNAEKFLDILKDVNIKVFFYVHGSSSIIHIY
jgi:hypothetical protein